MTSVLWPDSAAPKEPERFNVRATEQRHSPPQGILAYHQSN
jgi:hypothetical protein